MRTYYEPAVLLFATSARMIRTMSSIETSIRREGAARLDPAQHPEDEAASSDSDPIDCWTEADAKDSSTICSRHPSAAAAAAATQEHSRNLPPSRNHPHEEDEQRRRRLPLGTFAAGTSIYRNRLHAGERFCCGQEAADGGFVSLANLVLPDTEHCLCTTFVPPAQSWLEDVLLMDDSNSNCVVPNLLIVCQDNRSAQVARHVGDAELVPMPQSAAVPQSAAAHPRKKRKRREEEGITDPDRRDDEEEDTDEVENLVDDDNEQEPPNQQRRSWHWLYCKPHTGGCLHGKLLLFRNRAGLRVVVSGNNFYQEQWEMDRDCLWIQDFYATKQDYNAYSAAALSVFLSDLTRCRDPEHQSFVKEHLHSLFRNVDLTTVSARLVFSFPRPGRNAASKKELKGGWVQLSNAVKGLLEELGCDAETRDDSDTMMYAMAGSMGNLKPDFLLQMKHAMHGKPFHTPKGKEWDWDDVDGVRCLWPSRQTALSSRYWALVDSMRPMPISHWKTIPKTARCRIFFDALPNPPQFGLPEQNCHAMSHAKVLIETAGDVGILYVGSHNFSQAAWGLKGQSPKNVEVGVVLASRSMRVRREWVSRLPFLLPDRNAESPSSYIPASASGGVREAYESGNPNADRMFRDYLKSTREDY